ncbi:hypothetical protein ACHAXA_009916 [Cyclostephanos tholiformis]|uniref:Dynactin subunit 5 n=1 Tax=Cyclostephanos tholiformis TaxID=382380 RepID=A0ABD3RXY2_9STRA
MASVISSTPPPPVGDTRSDDDAPPPDKSSDYIRTTTQNYISRNAKISGAHNLVAGGRSIVKSGVEIRGDYGVPIYVGRYCRFDEGVVLTPCVVPKSSDPLHSPSSSMPPHPPGTNERAIPLSIGSHTRIGRDTILNSISIGSCVIIGSNCALMTRTKIHDCCVIEDGTVLPPDMVIPPYSRVRGNPGRIVGTIPECACVEFAEIRVGDYLDFVGGLVVDGNGN